MARLSDNRRNAAAYWLATGVPLALLLAGALLGGVWVWAGAVAIALVVTILDDAAAAFALPPAPGEAAGFQGHQALIVTLALGHFALLAVSVPALAGDTLGPWQKLGLFAGCGLYLGQISNANAHELIHRPKRGLVALGRWMYAAILFGHHASAHPLVHHVHVATDRDPNSAPLGMGFYRYALRAWGGSWRAGLEAETARLARSPAPGIHPYVLYHVVSALSLLTAFVLAGGWGVLALLALSAYAQAQLLLSDYVQHYGLRRATGPNGRPEPVGPAHSWNAPSRITGFMMLQSTRHSDHHTAPWRPFTELSLPAPHEAPTLPASLPMMATAALVPPLWHRLMDRRAAFWSRAETPLAVAAE